MKKLIVSILIVLSTSIVMFSQDIIDDSLGDTDFSSIDIDSLFSDEDSLIVSEESVRNDTIAEDLDKESMVITGNLSASGSYSIVRDNLDGTTNDIDANSFSSSISGGLNLDARLMKGIKGFASIGVTYNPSGSSTSAYTVQSSSSSAYSTGDSLI